MKRLSRRTTRGGSLLTFLGLLLAIYWMHPGQIYAQSLVTRIAGWNPV